MSKSLILHDGQTPAIPEKRGKGERLTTTKRDQMRQVWVEHRTIEGVCRACGVHHATVSKYRKLENWDAYAARVDAIVEKKTAEKLGERRSRNLKITAAAILKMAKSLQGQERVAFSAHEFDRLARLEEFLTGGADNRLEWITYERDPEKLKARLLEIAVEEQAVIEDNE